MRVYNKTFIEQRKAYFASVINPPLYDKVFVSVQTNENNYSQWLMFGEAISKFDWDGLMSENFHRSRLLNEWIFDIDGNSWDSVRALAENLESALIGLGIPFYRWSSGRWLHYHIFVDPIITIPENLKRYHFAKILQIENTREIDEVDLQSEIFSHVPRTIADYLPKVEDAYFDFSINESKHLIRAEGSLNFKTKARKSYLDVLPEKQPLIRKSKDVVFPDKIEFFGNQKLANKLFSLAYKKYILPRYSIRFIRKEISEDRKGIKTIGWIEDLLKTTIPDGRKRCVNLILAPYLVNVKGIGEDEAFQIIKNWIELCYQKYPPNKRRIRDTEIRYQLQYAKERRLVPLAKKSLERWGLEFIAEYI